MVVHLDRNDSDIVAAVRKIAECIDEASAAADEASEKDEKRRIQQASQKESKETKINRLLGEWWEKRDPAQLPEA
jgi:hypothetical protein